MINLFGIVEELSKMIITKAEVEEMKAYLKSRDEGLEKYATGFVRLYKVGEELERKDGLLSDLKSLYKIKREVEKANLYINKDFKEDLKRQIEHNIKALTMIAYIKKRDWEKVGICGNCYGTTRVGCSDPYAHSWETESCDCDWNYIEGWQLKNGVDSWSKEHAKEGYKYDYKLLDTEVMLKYLMGYEMLK